MKNGVILALDRTGCLQTARWSDVDRNGSQRRTLSQIKSVSVPSPDRVLEIRNDTGLREVAVFSSTVVCIGESPPEDHPHVALRIGRDGRITCPYCGTTYRSWRG